MAVDSYERRELHDPLGDYSGVYVGWNRKDGRGVDTVRMEPDEARLYALALIKAADKADEAEY